MLGHVLIFIWQIFLTMVGQTWLHVHSKKFSRFLPWFSVWKDERITYFFISSATRHTYIEAQYSIGSCINSFKMHAFGNTFSSILLFILPYTSRYCGQSGQSFFRWQPREKQTSGFGGTAAHCRPGGAQCWVPLLRWPRLVLVAAACITVTHVSCFRDMVGNTTYTATLVDAIWFNVAAVRGPLEVFGYQSLASSPGVSVFDLGKQVHGPHCSPQRGYLLALCPAGVAQQG